MKVCREVRTCESPAATSSAGALVREELLRRHRAGSFLQVRNVLMEEVNLVRRLDRFDAAGGEGIE
jgi:hypothetical protein